MDTFSGRGESPLPAVPGGLQSPSGGRVCQFAPEDAEREDQAHHMTTTTISVGDAASSECYHAHSAGGEFIDQSLGAVLAQDYPRDHLEVIVVDGMSTDVTRVVVSAMLRKDSRVRLLDNPRGIVSTGMNIGIAVATGDVLIRIDGHCIIAPDYVRRCVEHLRRDGVDGVGGPVQTIGRTITGRVIARAMSSKFGVGGSAFRTTTDKTMLSDTVPFPAYRRSTVERAGQFDEELVRNQDDEYNYRLRKLGAKLLLASDVRSDYYSRSTYRSLGSQFFQYGFWKVRVMQKHPLQMSARQFVPIVFVLALHAFLLAWVIFGVAWPLLVISTLYIAFCCHRSYRGRSQTQRRACASSRSLVRLDPFWIRA